MVERVIIDTDPGIDDALALLLALQTPDLEVAAITTVSGNVPVDRATRNVMTILSLLPEKQCLPVAEGAAKPMKKAPVYATHVHGEDGLGGLERFRSEDGSPRYQPLDRVLSKRDAADEILHQIAVSSEPVTVIPIGPLTNIAAAIERDKTAMAKAKGIVLMGGAIGVSGNVTPAAEFNIFVDPHAAKIVFDAGIPLTIIGLDVTQQVALHKERLEKAIAPQGTVISQFICDCTSEYFNFAQKLLGESRLLLHDPLAIGAVIDPTLVATELLHVAVETAGEVTEGMTLADRRPFKSDWKKPPNAEVCLGVDGDRFVSFFIENVLGGSGSL